MMDIIVCDDHPVVRAGLTQIMLAGFESVSIREAESAQTLLDLVREKSGDVVVLDVSLPGRGGLEVLRQLKQERPRLPVLMLSVHPADQYAIRAIRAGASGYLTKDLAKEELVKAVQVVVGGHHYVTADVADRLAEGLDRQTEALHESLSDREFEIMTLIASGKCVREIADMLCLSYNTISTYRSRVLEKLCLKTNANIVRYALQYKLIE
jgi:DNA-binding NarL/FixJ family response regulator